jgi:hypothetical protein
MISRRELYAMGEPFGESCTRMESGRLICGGGGGDSGKSTTTTEIPKELKPLATAYADKAMGLSNQPFQRYPDQLRYQPFNQYQDQGIARVAQRVGAGSPTISNAEAQLNNIISGGNTNPYLDKMVSKAQDSVRSQFNTGAVNSGSFGNSGLQEQFADSLGNVATQMYGQAYDQDRARQMQGIGMAQQFGNQAYTDAAQMLNIGQMVQDQAQQISDFDYQQFQEYRDLPYKQLAAMAGVFGSGLGQTSTTKSSGGGGK